MQPELLFPFALQHVVSGAVLYTLYALQSEIDAANNNLRANLIGHRFVLVDGPPKPFPPSRSQ